MVQHNRKTYVIIDQLPTEFLVPCRARDLARTTLPGYQAELVSAEAHTHLHYLK